MYIVVLLVVYRCSACDMSSDTERDPIGLRTPSDQIASAVRSDCVRCPMRFRDKIVIDMKKGRHFLFEVSAFYSLRRF